MSLVEVLIALAAIAVVATIGIQVTYSLSSTSKRAKLNSDTATLNRAVTMYLASGGDLSDATAPADVLARLKTRSSVERVKTQINPLTRSMIDPRLVAVLQTDSEAQSDQPRAYWDAGELSFEVKTEGGPGGIRKFAFSDEAAAEAGQIEARESGSMEFASESGWIWDYKDHSDSGPTASLIPTSVATTPPTLSTPVAPTPKPAYLQPPVYSIAGGVFPATDFDLSLTLTNPNPSGSSHLRYSINYGAWELYSGAVAVPLDARVIAKSVSNDSSKWYDSSPRTEIYSATLVELDPPSISLSEAGFSNSIDLITVTISDNNLPGLAELRYDIKTPTGSYQPVQLWSVYAPSFDVSVNDFPDGFDVIAYAKAIDPNVYEHSEDIETSTDASFFDVPLSGDVLFVIDASSSMGASFGSQTRFEAVIDETVKAIDGMRPNQKVNVAMFDEGSHWTDGTFKLHNNTPPKKPQLMSQIQTIDHGSGTNYQAALSFPLQYKPYPESVIFLTDGEPDGQSYSAELAALAAEGIPVNVIGIDLNASTQAKVQAIADATGGTVSTLEAP